MNCKKTIFNIFFLFILFFGLFGLAKASRAATINASSCSLANVQAAVSSANHGDTVIIPAGSCTWSSSLNIYKSIKLKGTGNGSDSGSNTIITSTKQATNYPNNDKNNYLISIPNPASSDISGFANNTMEISDIRLNGSGSAGHILFINNSTSFFPVKYHDLVMTKCITNPDAGSIYGYNTLVFTGNFRGVVYDNNFTGNPFFKINGAEISGYGGLEWTTHKYSYPTTNYLYFEDNTIVSEKTNSLSVYLARSSTDDAPLINSVGWGGYAIFRYNSVLSYGVKETRMNKNHGSSYGLTGARGMEIYGNHYASVSTAPIQTLADIEQGKNLIFFNKYQLPDATKLNSYLFLQFPDNYYTQAGAYTLTKCGSGDEYIYDGQPFCSAMDNPPVPLHPSRCYYWSNLYNNSPDGSGTLFGNKIYGADRGAGVKPEENKQFWKDNSGCSGSSCTAGIGCGSILPATCTYGTGYWLTTQGNCSNITGYIGPNPSQGAIKGTLYRCDPANTWTAYYAPYTYPHPMRGETSNTPPAAPKGVNVR